MSLMGRKCELANVHYREAKNKANWDFWAATEVRNRQSVSSSSPSYYNYYYN